MCEKPAVVEPFESGANQRSVGTVNGRDLVAMKKQLGDFEVSLKQFAKDIVAKKSPTDNAPEHAIIYPVLGAGAPEPVKALPVIPSQHPEGIVEDIEGVIKTIMSVVQQITELSKPIKTACAGASASANCPASVPIPVRVPNFAALQTHTPPASPVFSRTLPGMEPEPKIPDKKKAKDVAREDRAADKIKDEVNVTLPVVEPKKYIDPPSSELIKEAHELLDVLIKKGLVANPSELIVGTEDEFYCIKKFRKMVLDEQERVAQNFHKRLDKLCSKN